MASALLRTSARRRGPFRCFVSAARSGGEGLAPLGRCAVRPLSNSTTRGDQLPGNPNENKVNFDFFFTPRGCLSLP